MALVSLVAGAFRAIHPPEPSYQGKRLGEWLQDCDIDNAVLGSAVQAAVREIGTNALPRLVQMMATRESLQALDDEDATTRRCVWVASLG